MSDGYLQHIVKYPDTTKRQTLTRVCRFYHNFINAVVYLLIQLGGPDGEIAASMRYLNQRYTAPYGELRGLLTDIGTEESEH